MNLMQLPDEQNSKRQDYYWLVTDNPKRGNRNNKENELRSEV